MDVRCLPGSLIELTNAHISRGGEIEKRPAFVEVCDLLSETVGLVSGGSLYDSQNVTVFHYVPRRNA